MAGLALAHLRGLDVVARLGAVSCPRRCGTLRGRFTWQAWNLATFTFIWLGRRGTWRHPPSFGVAGMALMTPGWIWWRAWALLVARGAAALCMAGVALGDIHLRFTWQAWHLATSTFVSRGRRGTWRHPPSFHVAGVALGDIHLCFAWQACHV